MILAYCVLFSLKHIFKWIYKYLSRNLRLFFKLLLMDTQLAENQQLVNRIKAEASSFGFFEAFLESTPQFILQLSIVLRTGNISKIIDKLKKNICGKNQHICCGCNLCSWWPWGWRVAQISHMLICWNKRDEVLTK